jgi:hypothetical protein
MINPNLNKHAYLLFPTTIQRRTSNQFSVLILKCNDTLFEIYK